MAGVDLLLIRPPARTPRPPSLVPPLGLLYVAAAARQAGLRVGLIDAPAEGLRLAEVVERAAAAGPAVIGLGGFTPTFGETTRAAGALAGVAERLVVGGAHASVHAGPILDQLPEVDAVVVGEAEATIGPLLRWLDRGGRGAPPAGVLVRGQTLRRRPREPRLDRLPPPARDLVDPRRYRYPMATRPGLATLMTGRGCPRGCVFCDKAVSGARSRLHGAERVIDELTEVARDRRVGYAVLFDDDFAADRDRVATICEGVATAGLDLAWKCEARADAVDEALLRQMGAAGCRLVAMGVESAHGRSLERLGKELDPARTRAAFEAARRAGIDTLAYVLVGIPGETVGDVLATADFCREIGARWVQFSTLSPYPGTALHAQATRRGWLAAEGPRNPVDAERRRATLLAPPWTDRRLREALWRAHARFYLRPGFAWSLARGAAGGAPLGPVLRAGGAVSRWLAAEGLRLVVRRPAA